MSNEAPYLVFKCSLLLDNSGSNSQALGRPKMSGVNYQNHMRQAQQYSTINLGPKIGFSFVVTPAN